MVILSVGHIFTGGFAKNNIALTVMVCVALFEAIGEIQR